MQAEASLGGEKRVTVLWVCGCVVYGLAFIELGKVLNLEYSYGKITSKRHKTELVCAKRKGKEGKRKLPSREPLFVFDNSFAFHMSVISTSRV